MPPDPERGVDDHNVMCSGRLQRLRFDLEPGDTARHGFAACFLAPGLYRVYAYELSARTRGGGEPGCAVQSAFVLVR